MLPFRHLVGFLPLLLVAFAALDSSSPAPAASASNTALAKVSSTAPAGDSSDLPLPQDPGTSGYKDFGNGLIYESENFHGLSALCKSPYIFREQCLQAYANLYDDLVYAPGYRMKGSANLDWFCELKFEGDAKLPGEYAKDLASHMYGRWSSAVGGNIVYIFNGVKGQLTFDFCDICHASKHQPKASTSLPVASVTSTAAS